MGTSCAIFVKEPTSKKFIGFEVHYDGYLKGVGKTLLEHYGLDETLKLAFAINRKRRGFLR